MPFHINIIFNVGKDSCSRKFYLDFNKTESDVPLCKIKWNNEFDYLLHKDHWKVLYKICFQSLTDKTFVKVTTHLQHTHGIIYDFRYQ